MIDNNMKKISIFGAGCIGCAFAGTKSYRYELDLYDISYLRSFG